MDKPADSPGISRTMPSCTIVPVLIYRDVAAAITWLRQAFGFKERWRAGNHRAQLSFGEGTIAIRERYSPRAVHPDEAAVRAAEPLSTLYSVLVRVPDVLDHYEHARKNGARILQPLADFHYGERQYSAEDIGGHTWTFSQSIADLAPEDWGGTTADDRTQMTEQQMTEQQMRTIDDRTTET